MRLWPRSTVVATTAPSPGFTRSLRGLPGSGESAGTVASQA